jgi:ABC-2 type transport system ATP-binding protein
VYERLSAYENMAFFAEAYGLSNGKNKQSRIRGLLEFFDLWERRNDKVTRFSRGMKQKLAIARALVHNPPILLLDEPTAGLDPESAKAIRDLIEDLSRHEKHTIVLCTHHLEDAERLCRRLMIISRGKNILVGTPENLRDRAIDQPVVKVTLGELNQRIVEAVERVKHVTEVNVDNSTSELTISVDDARSVTPEVVRSIVKADGKILSVNVLRPTLEDAYLKLVKEERT